MISFSEERQPWSPPGPCVVLDTSVLADFALGSASRHNDAVRLMEALVARSIRTVVPFHAAIEFMCTLRRVVRCEDGHQSPHAANMPGTIQLKLLAVPIDSDFMQRYPTSDLPLLKAGDILFLAIARAGAVPLLTEDKKLYSQAKSVGVQSFTIQEYLARMRANAG
jgi:predicted nucleic acid-binding protein